MKQEQKPSEPAEKEGMLWCFACSKEATPQCVTNHTTIWKENWEEEVKHLAGASPLVKQAVEEGKVPLPKTDAAPVGKSIIQSLKDLADKIQVFPELGTDNIPTCEICREQQSKVMYQGVRVCASCYQELRA